MLCHDVFARYDHTPTGHGHLRIFFALLRVLSLIYIIQMICSRSAEREYPSGQRAGVRLGNPGFNSNPRTGRGAEMPIFSSDRRAQRPAGIGASTWGAEGAKVKIEKNIQLHYPRPPSIEK